MCVCLCVCVSMYLYIHRILQKPNGCRIKELFVVQRRDWVAIKFCCRTVLIVNYVYLVDCVIRFFKTIKSLYTINNYKDKHCSNKNV